MFVAKVTGSLVSTQKLDAIVGYKLLIVEPYRLEATERQIAGDAPAARSSPWTRWGRARGTTC